MSSDGYYTEEVHGPHEYLDLGNFELASGFLLPQAKLAYKTIGTLNEAKDNAILLPHMYTGTSAFMTAYVGETGTCWGHFTMFNLREQDTAAIDAIYAEALAS
jgi:homoserine acetyltransferase